MFPIILIYTFLLGLTYKSLGWEISISGVTSSAHCAKIYTQEKFQGSSLFMKDKEHIPYMSDMQSWDETTKISVKVNPSCTLTIATRPFLRGTQHELREDTTRFQFEGGVDSFQNSSMMCSCYKRCSCDELVFRGRECARGYFKTDCTDCDAYYTSFKQGGQTNFPSKLASSVQSLAIRPTCTLSLQYRSVAGGELETLDIQTATKSEIVPFTGLISTTSCECNTTDPEYKSTKLRIHKPSDPPLLILPSLRGEINAQFKKDGQKNHPGLLAALQSLRAKRSPTNAYILLLGLSGSGKSTAVNLLFDHPNITQVGSAQSTTTDIHEFRIPVQMDELGIKNSELRIIDTPGIADTRGIAQDARFLATLDGFLSKHEDLRRYVPNVVLIFVKFHDNRFNGEGSAFVKMLKTIELFRTRLVDPKSSNVIFVLTHFMSETKEIQRNPERKIESFKKVIEEYSSLPKPIVLVVAENKPEVSELLSLNGYWTLPNGDVYPKNLFDQMQRTLSSCGDPIGLGVIQTAFSHSDEFEIEGRTTEIFNSSHKYVAKYLSDLSAFERPPASSEVTEALDLAFVHLAPELKSQYPSVLLHLKKAFAIKNVDTLSKIPKTTPKILEFLKDINRNEASLFLLERAFNITVPVYDSRHLVGSGYDLLNDRRLGTPIFNLSSGLYLSEIGFQIPEHITVSFSSEIRNVFAIMSSRHEYVETRLQNLGLEQDSTGVEELLSNSRGTEAGLNIVTSPDQQNLKLSALIEYQTFNMMLDKGATLSEEYLTHLRSLGTFDKTNFESVRAWNSFFQLYGTHAVVSASGGGSIAVEVKMNEFYASLVSNDIIQANETEDEQNDETTSNSQSDYQTANEQLQSQVASVDRFTRLSQAMSLIVQYLANNFLGKETPVTIPEGVTYSIRMRGGDPKFYISNITHHGANGEQVEIWNILDKWQTSVQYQPEILTSYLRLIPMSEILHNLPGLETEAAAVKVAAGSFLNASLVYVPRIAVYNSLEDRDHTGTSTAHSGDFQSLQELSQLFSTISAQSRQTQHNFLTTMMGLQKENERQADLFEQRRMDDTFIELERQKQLLEDEKWNSEMQSKQDKATYCREKHEELIRIQKFQTAADLRTHQTSELIEMHARNEKTFYSFFGSEVIRQRQLAIARQNQPNWFVRTLGTVLGGPVIGAILG